jgi:hypothetical protein
MRRLSVPLLAILVDFKTHYRLQHFCMHFLKFAPQRSADYVTSFGHVRQACRLRYVILHNIDGEVP